MSYATPAPRSPGAPQNTGRASRWWLVRIITGCAGLAALAALTVTGAQPAGNVIGTVALGALALAAGAALFEARALGGSGERPVSATRRRAWHGAYVLCLAVPALAVQSWFAPGGAVAFGDISPPAGTAWIARLFELWQWSGSNLGAPAEPLGAPWAAVLALVHGAGGTAALAQRLWFTLLLAGAAVAALTLLRQLQVQPVGASAGALVYVFNPFVFSVVGTNAVYIAALVLLAALPASLLAAGRGALRLRWSVALWVLSAPLIGYVYYNPPLVLLIAAACILTPALAWARFGPAGARRSALALGSGGVAAGLANAFWLVPALIAQGTVAAASLSAPASWTWTEGRATIPNALWLNSTWAWKYPIYYPYAHLYDGFPLAIAKYALPLIAFSALLAVSRSRRTLRLVAGCALGVLAVAFISTGTRLPGSLVFNTLYGLPYGWLLREPGRFLMGAVLLYAVLVGFAVNGALSRLRRTGASPVRRALGGLALLLGALAVAGCAFPLYSGVLVPGPRLGFPSTHVRMPAYWSRMAAWVNGSAPPGALLVMPADDFYQMPYTWYYGNDGFITDLIRRPVLDPSGQGYSTVSSVLLSTDKLVSTSILRHDWGSLNRILRALGTPLLLVRGDIEAGFPGRSIVAPARLSAALARDPAARMLHSAGPLQLWSLQPPPTRPVRTTYATVNTTQPDLRALSLLPPETWLVTGGPRAGHASLTYPAPGSDWTQVGDRLRTIVGTPPGWGYSVARLTASGAGKPTAIVAKRTVLTAGLTATRVHGRQGPALVLEQRLGRSLLADGDFAHGLWQPVGNCNDTAGAAARPLLHAVILSGAGPAATRALRLSAGIDSACEARALSWRHGSLYLSLNVRHVAGAPPRICLWETGLRRCVNTLPPLPSGRRWQAYRATVTPGRRAGALIIFLYADSLTAGQLTVNEYANVGAYALPSGAGAPPVVLGRPRRPQQGAHLTVSAQAYSSSWAAAGRHVLVDGLRNGWLADAAVTPHYSPAAIIAAADWVSGVTGAIILALACAAGVLALRRRALAGPGLRRAAVASVTGIRPKQTAQTAVKALSARAVAGLGAARRYTQDTRVLVAGAILTLALLGAGGVAYLLAGGAVAHHSHTAPIQTIVIQAPPAGRRAVRAAPRPRAHVTLRAPRQATSAEVRAWSATGRVLFDGVMRPGRALRFDLPLLWLRVGTPGELSVTVNGRPQSLPAGSASLLVSARGVSSGDA